MAVSDEAEAKRSADEGPLFQLGYQIFAYFGLMSLSAALLWGFRYSPDASWFNYAVDVLLYGAFIAPHLLLTQAEVKEQLWGRLAGTLRERQIYVAITVVTWLVVFWLHRPVSGGEIELPAAIRFGGYVAFLWSVLLFFEGHTREDLNGLLGVPGSRLQHTHGEQTPLRTEGQYAQVRHPMYRAVVLIGASALVIHPNVAQLLWSAMLGASFIGFIPFEEKLLLEARGDDYRRYCERTPYRLFRGIW